MRYYDSLTNIASEHHVGNPPVLNVTMSKRGSLNTGCILDICIWPVNFIRGPWFCRGRCICGGLFCGRRGCSQLFMPESADVIIHLIQEVSYPRCPTLNSRGKLSCIPPPEVSYRVYIWYRISWNVWSLWLLHPDCRWHLPSNTGGKLPTLSYT